MHKVLDGYNECLKDHTPSKYVGNSGDRMLDRMNIVPGLVLDLTGIRDDGSAWDFNDEDMAEEAEKMVDDKRAMLFIVSPLCAVETLAAKLGDLGLTQAELLEHRQRHADWCSGAYVGIQGR